MYTPNFKISPYLVSLLLKIDTLKNEIVALPVSKEALQRLKESSVIKSSHYSTYIEGNRLMMHEVADLLYAGKRFSEREKDEKEVLGYHAGLKLVDEFIKSNAPLSEEAIQKIHGVVMAGGEEGGLSLYRDGQNVIRDSRSGEIVYLPPEATDVPGLMSDLVRWLVQGEKDEFPGPISAAIAHYQFATIHPYYDGNGRTARLFADWILHRTGYGVMGICSLEGYYAEGLKAYYDAIDNGPSHNYYFGRQEADITSWIEYFCEGMLESLQSTKDYAKKVMRKEFREELFKVGRLSRFQHALVEFFNYHDILTASDVERLFRVSGGTARGWVRSWVVEGFLIVDNPSKKKRTYRLNEVYRKGISRF